jgi:hypothetical protein
MKTTATPVAASNRPIRCPLVEPDGLSALRKTPELESRRFPNEPPTAPHSSSP